MALTAQTRDAFERLGAAVVAVADPDPAALQTTAALLDLPPSALFADFSALLELNPPLDAILIASPMEYHGAQSIAALERGIHVLCEVTLAVTVDECKAVVQAAERDSNTAIQQAVRQADLEKKTVLKPNSLSPT